MAWRLASAGGCGWRLSALYVGVSIKLAGVAGLNLCNGQCVQSATA